MLFMNILSDTEKYSRGVPQSNRYALNFRLQKFLKILDLPLTKFLLALFKRKINLKCHLIKKFEDVNLTKDKNDG